LKKSIFKVSALIDPSQIQEMLSGLVAIGAHSNGKLDQMLDGTVNLPNVIWAAAVAGRYDIIAEVIFVKGKDELYRFTTNTILKIANMIRSERFIIMIPRNIWLQLPKDVEKIYMTKKEIPSQIPLKMQINH
jgi:DNA-binding Lrp family transcriptional regulator